MTQVTKAGEVISELATIAKVMLRRTRDIELVHVYPAGAATKGAKGERMAEIGLMREAGCGERMRSRRRVAAACRAQYASRPRRSASCIAAR